MKKILFFFFTFLVLATASASATVWPRTYGSWSRLANGGTVSGTIKVPVIFVNFSQSNSDDAYVVSDANQTAWINDLNATTGYGAKQYFSDMSYGNVNVEFVKVGSYTASGKASAYANTYVNLVSTAVQGVNYSSWGNFDSNNDGFVDMVLLIFAGHADGDYTSGSKSVTSIYPASGWLDSSSGSGTTISGISNLKFSRYLYVNDLATYSSSRANLGTAIHELGHALFDLPDYYNKSTGSPSYGSNMGYWDCMDYGTFFGEYAHQSNAVPGLSAFSKMLNGWLTPRELTYGQHVKLNPLNDAADACMITTNDANKYYILEARHATSGSWDNGLASGLILTYVNEGNTANFIVNHNTNNGTVTVVRADGTSWTSSNYSSNIATQPFGPNVKSIPSSVNSIFATKTVENIVVNSDGSVEFDFMGGATNVCHLEFASPSVDMTVGGKQTNTLSGIPTGYDGKVTFSSNNTGVATVNASTGEVTAVAAGVATITATATTTANYEGGTQTYTVIVREVAQSVNDLTDGTIVMVSNYYGLGNLVNDNGTVKALGGSQAAVDAVFPGYGYNTAYANGFDKTIDNHLWKVTTVGGKKYLVNVGSNQYLSVANPTVLTSTSTAATFTAVNGLSNVYAISTTNEQYMSASVFKANANNIVSNYSPNGASFTHTISNYTSDQTLHITADLSNCSSTNENILSLGNNISAWDGAHVHMYYTKSSKALQIWFLNNVASGGEKVTVTLSSNTLDVTLKNNILTVNGTDYTVAAHAQLAGLTGLSTIEVGSQEGSTRSKATNYNISVISGVESQHPVSAATSQDASTAWALYTVSTVVDDRTDVTASFAETSATVEKGETYTQAVTTNCSAATVVYSIAPSSVATINAATGEVTAVGAGTATISATVTAPANDANYKGTATATYTLTVTEQEVDPVDPVDPDEPGDVEVYYEIVYNADQITEGDEVIFVYEAGNLAMSDVTTTGYNYTAVGVTLNNHKYEGTVNAEDVPYSFRVLKTEDKFNFMSIANGKYLSDYAEGNYQYPYFSETARDYGVSIDASTGIATISLTSNLGNEMFFTYYADYDDFEYSMTSWGDSPNFAIYKKVIKGENVEGILNMAVKQVAHEETVTKTVYKASTAAITKGATTEFLILSQNGWWGMGNSATASVGGPGATATYTDAVNTSGKLYTFKWTSQGYLYNVGLDQYLNSSGNNLSYGAIGSTVWNITGSGSSCVIKNGNKSIKSPTAEAGAFTYANGNNNLTIFTPSTESVTTTIYTDANPLVFSIKADYATLYSADAYKMPGTDIVGYFIEDAQRTGTLTPIRRYVSGDIVPAGTALLLTGNTGTYEATLYEEKQGGTESAIVYVDAKDNQLEGTRDVQGYTNSARSNVYYYKLTWKDSSNHDAGLGFYWGAEGGAAFKLSNAYTAYLAVDKETATNSRGFILPNTSEESVLTRIEEVEEAAEGIADAAIYNLRGQRMNATYLPAGIYVQGGKKIIIK